MVCIRILIAFSACCLLLHTPPGYAKSTVDATQAQAMVAFLQRCNAGSASTQDIDRLMSLSGTQLIIAQQNISRRITAAQYRKVLTSACKGHVTHVEPSEAGTRAEKGVQGLTNDVAPSLIWGKQNVAILQKRLKFAEANESFDQVVPLALKNMPEPIKLSPKLYFVMGGRAGAAASEKGIYIDLLADLWRSKGHSSPMTEEQMVEFLAHETHHIGYGRILDQKRERLHVQGGQLQAWNFLADILMEGSATLLINGHGSWADLEKQQHIQADLARLPTLLSESQEILQRSVDGTMTSKAYETAGADFLGEGYHATGAKLLYVIEEVRGKAGVFAVMDDPTSLLAVYNDCARQKGETFLFRSELTKKLETMGANR